MLLAALLSGAALAAEPPRRFALAGRPQAGEVAVAPGAPYDPARGFGYEPGGTPAARLFSVRVPEGNWRVTVRYGDARRAGRTTTKAESRRLMLPPVDTRAGQRVTRSFLVNVRTADLTAPPANAPGGVAVRLNPREAGSFTWDDKLTLEFLGSPAVEGIEIAPADVPTVYLVGDSTVTDQRAEPAASWGQMLPVFVDGAAIANHAESGETMKSFLSELRLAKALSAMRKGDWLLIQFGHNDQKASWPQTYADPTHAYPAYLRAFIAEARARGATPVLVTSPERRNFGGDGRITATLADYVAAVKRVAAEEKVALVDLNADSVALYQALGPQRSPAMFNEGGADRTHHNNYGAWLLARSVAERLKQTGLAAHLAPMAPFDPHHPPAEASIGIAPSVAVSSERPAGS